MTDLDKAYGLRTPKDSKTLYAEWAESYDSEFAADMDYRLPLSVAQVFAQLGPGKTPVLDVGAGTGLLAQALPAGVEVDAVDISAEMLAVAAGKGLYRHRIVADLLQPLPLAQGTYGAVVSAGTFTHGHVGPEAIDGLLTVAQPGALFVLGINAEHFEARGFSAKFSQIADRIGSYHTRDVLIYGSSGRDDHAGDMARIVSFFRN